MKIFPIRIEKPTIVNNCVCRKRQTGTMKIDKTRIKVRLGLVLLILLVIISLMIDGGGVHGRGWFGAAVLVFGLSWLPFEAFRNLSSGHSLLCSLRQAALKVA